MFSRLDDILALIGAALFLAGVYLWFGLPPALMLAGAILVFVAVRLDTAKGVKHVPD